MVNRSPCALTMWRVLDILFFLHVASSFAHEVRQAQRGIKWCLKFVDYRKVYVDSDQ